MNLHSPPGIRVSRSRRSRRRAVSALWFVAIIVTVGLAGANPLLGFPVAVGLIFLSIVFPSDRECDTVKSDSEDN